MPITVLGGTKVADTGYEVANSVRFNRGDSPRLSKTFGTPTNQDRWTFSVWCKRSGLGTTQNLCACQSSGTKLTSLRFDSDNCLNFYDYNGAYTGQIKTIRDFRDVSAWYHIVIVWDSANGTAGDRMKMYVNGVEETVFSADTNPSSGLDSDMNTSGETFDLGNANNGNFFDGYLAEAVFVDGQALAPTSFGEFDEDSPTIWKPKDVSELTFGDNGGYFDFEDSGNLGDDESGNTNDLTEANLAATDQCMDSPTNNFCTLLNIAPHASSTEMMEAGTKWQGTGSPAWRATIGTIAPTVGKWYYECKIGDASGAFWEYGIAAIPEATVTAFYNDECGGAAPGPTYALDSRFSKVYYGTSSANGQKSDADYDTFTTNDIMGCAIDLDNNRLYWAKNGTWLNSSDPTDGTNAFSIEDGYVYAPAVWVNKPDAGGTRNILVNFGCPPYANSSDANDANGYGVFEYAPPSGYLSLCTKNLGSDGG